MDRNNEYLDTPRPEDELIGDDYINEHGLRCKMINGIEVIQGDEPKTQHQKDLELVINRFRASGLSHSDWFNSVTKR